MPNVAQRAIEVYEKAIAAGGQPRMLEDSAWHQAIHYLKAEWDILRNMAESASDALADEFREKTSDLKRNEKDAV
jgi:hypothetical protein